MTTLAWILALAFAALSAFLWIRGRSDPHGPSGLGPLLQELKSGRVSKASDEGESDEVRKLRRVLRDDWAPRGRERPSSGDEALIRIARYLEEMVVRPLEAGSAGDGDPVAAAGEALDALADLEFFTRDRDEDAQAGNLTSAIQEVTREFALEYAVPVKLRGAERPVRARFPTESLKDAVYLLLVNGARFGDDRAVEVFIEGGDGGPNGPRVRIVDQGRGFSEEALHKGMEPFFTTERDSLGLGLTHVRQVVEGAGGVVRIRNRDGGGAEVEIRVPPPA